MGEVQLAECSSSSSPLTMKVKVSEYGLPLNPREIYVVPCGKEGYLEKKKRAFDCFNTLAPSYMKVTRCKRLVHKNIDCYWEVKYRFKDPNRRITKDPAEAQEIFYDIGRMIPANVSLKSTTRVTSPIHEQAYDTTYKVTSCQCSEDEAHDADCDSL